MDSAANSNVQPGTEPCDPRYRVLVQKEGPYMVYGKPPLKEQIITPDEEHEMWTFTEGKSFAMDQEPVALCRCGASARKPYCDGAHTSADWSPELKPQEEPLLAGAELYPGPEVSLTDNEKYCVLARFCDAKGSVWDLVGESGDPQKKDYTVHEANMCPGGRLSAWNNHTQKPIEVKYEPSLGLIQDPALGVSGGLWVRGGMQIHSEDGKSYEIRNRVMLCRCGQASNKPFCDGTHSSIDFQDELKNG